MVEISCRCLLVNLRGRFNKCLYIPLEIFRMQMLGVVETYG